MGIHQTNHSGALSTGMSHNSKHLRYLKGGEIEHNVAICTNLNAANPNRS
jgi:hypothetical protein